MKNQVFILLGQSNAVGHDLPMLEADKIKIPFKNVFGLSRADNQTYDNKELVWSGYLSAGMNLGETQDHTYSLANCIAKKWQERIDSGEDLADLYIVQIAIGAQGVTKSFMWYPHKEQILVPGHLGEANISLYSFSCHILSLIDESFKKRGLEYEIMGLHWRGGEEEVTIPISELKSSLKDIYEELFLGLWNALGEKAKTVLHRLVMEDMVIFDPTKTRSERMDYINSVFESMAQKHPNIVLFDPRTCPLYSPKIEGRGILKEDNVHFTKEANESIAEMILEGTI